MYQALTFYHSIVRWLVLASLVYAILIAYKGYRSNAVFSKTDNTVMHWTATIAHVQLMIGIVLFSQSPVTKYFWSNAGQHLRNIDLAFFGFIHEVLMLMAIVLITIGSALAKRKQTDHEQFRAMLVWFSISLVIIFIAIPWPFSPLASRPYFR